MKHTVNYVCKPNVMCVQKWITDFGNCFCSNYIGIVDLVCSKETLPVSKQRILMK